MDPLEFVAFDCSPDVVAELHRLTGIPFRKQTFHAAWSDRGWEVRPSRSAYDWVVYWVTLPDDLKLEVFPGGDQIYGVALTLSFQGERHREQYDACYDNTRALAVEAIGAPTSEGTDHNGEATRRYALWRGSHGVLVLQQDAIDFQRGGQVAFWLLPLRPSERLPESDIMVWTEGKICERF
jgi:hypothetical protein